jgi:DNA-binding XRE family transcriptional regulator
MKITITEQHGQPFALVPLPFYEQLCQDSEMLADIALYDLAKANPEEQFPHVIVKELLDGVHPIRVYRQYRQITQQELAMRAGVKKSYISELETGRKRGSFAVQLRIAAALNVDVEQLAYVAHS